MKSNEAELRPRRISKSSQVQIVLLAKLVMVACYVVSPAMADFISNSAILTAIRPRDVLTAAPNSGPGREKWQTLR